MDCKRGTHQLLIGDVFQVLPTLKPRSVHQIITSPPYWNLRDYGTAAWEGGDPECDHRPARLLEGRNEDRQMLGQSYATNQSQIIAYHKRSECERCGATKTDAQLGSEPTPELFVENLVKVFRLCRDVLRDDGTLWLNIGDSFAQGKTGRDDGGRTELDGYDRKAPGVSKRRDIPPAGNQAGDLLLMPHRVAMALQADGWVLRQTIVWCLSGGTWIYARTAKGDAPAMLKDLVRLDPATVQLWNGERWTRVVSWTRNDKDRGRKREGYLELELRSGERIGCTAEHHWPTGRGLLQAKDLRVGDVIPTCKLPEPEGSKRLCVDEAALGWAVGFYLAEGCRFDKGIRLSVHRSETREFERFRTIAEELDGSAQFRETLGNGAVIDVYSKPLAELIAQYVSGSDCRNKRLTRKAWMRSNAFLSAVIEGYLDGDGHRDEPNNRWRIGFGLNDGLAVDLRTACARLGYVCRLRRTVHQCQTGFFKGWRGEIRATKPSHHNAKDNGEIVAIRKSRAREYWDVEVADEPHLFALASGVLTHNCKRSPMPESVVSGWRWERCRVKNPDFREAKYEGKGNQQDARSASERIKLAAATARANGLDHEGDMSVTALKYLPCPGCDRCKPNNGWILRKSNWRPTSAFEYVFMFAKGMDYFCDGDGAMEQATAKPPGNKPGKLSKTSQTEGGSGVAKRRAIGLQEGQINQAVETRNPRNVWELSNEPEKEKHFAAFPSELVRRCLVAGTSPAGCCPICGNQWAPIVTRDQHQTRPAINNKIWKHDETGDPIAQRSESAVNTDPERKILTRKILGYRPSCDCRLEGGSIPEPIPSTVLDPFGGTGTTAQTAVHYGRDAILIELSGVYADIIERKVAKPPRCWLRAQAKAKKKAPRPVDDRQKNLFD